jgi:Zn-dependent peptidase ImmA (M78 family)
MSDNISTVDDRSAEILEGLDSPRWAFVKEMADKLSGQYSAPPIPVLDIAEKSGVDVVFADFAKLSDKVAGACDFSEQKLYVNSNDDFNRQLFTMAHELGHWVLHKQYFEAHPEKYRILPRLQKPDRSDPFEIEASNFALNLLVPSRLLDPVIEAPVSLLASIFVVSETMMQYRLNQMEKR